MSKNEQIEKRVNEGLDFVDQIINMLYQGIENQPENPQATKKIICKNLRYSYEAVDNTIYFYLPGHNNKTIAKWINPETRILTIAEKTDDGDKKIFELPINKKYRLTFIEVDVDTIVCIYDFHTYGVNNKVSVKVIINHHLI